MLLQSFFIEDIGDRDITSNAIFPSNAMGRGIFVAKEDGVISGLQLIKEAYYLFDSAIVVELGYKDGQWVRSGDIIAEVSGPIVYLLAGERVILNLVQRMSGIATMVRKSVETLNDDRTNICDTRKTTPGLRMLEKYAVTTGGGKNHRSGLYDGVMIKDNHISFCGSIGNAVRSVRENIGHMIKIEVETETKEQVLEAVESNADVIMFDNRKPAEVKEFAELVPTHIITEASGGITFGNLADYRQVGVDYISLGFITHSANALDISLQVHEGGVQ